MLDGLIVQIRRGAGEEGERGLAVRDGKRGAQKRMGPSVGTTEDDRKRAILT